MKKYIYTLVLLVAMQFLTACSGINVAGKKDPNFDGEVRTLLIVIQDSWKQAPGQYQAFPDADIRAYVQRITVGLSARLPIVFNLNEIETRVVLASQYADKEAIPITSSEYVMLIQPSTASGRGAVENIGYAVNITKAGVPRPVWSGGMTIALSLNAWNDNKSLEDDSDEFARRVLLRLKTDGVISKKIPQVRMPGKA